MTTLIFNRAINLGVGFMRLKWLLSLCIFTLILACLHSGQMVLADVPKIQVITREKEGGKTLLQVEVSHSSPSTSHYVDVIEFDINGEVHKATDLEPQSDRVFNYTYDAGGVEASNIKVRAHCNLHGWSSWNIEEKGEEGEGAGIPGFPYESVFLGVLLGVLILWTLQRKR